MNPLINIKKEISEVSKCASTLKKNIIKSMLRVDRSDTKYIDEYLTFVNNFTKKWEEYGNDISYSMRRYTNDNSSPHTPSYNKIKKYIYADYDYASILQFTDGVIKGIEDGKFTSNEDVVDFMSYTTLKAFRGLSETTAEIVEDVLSDIIINTTKDADKFNVIRDYNIINRADRKIIYKSIENVLKWLMREVVNNFLSNNENLFNYDKMMISMINAVIDYATYTLTAYAIRIYAIGRFVSPFLYDTTKTSTSFDESANFTDYHRSAITLMKKANDFSFRDPQKINNTIDSLTEFAETIGCSDMDSFETYKSYDKIIEKVRNNDLYKLLGIESPEELITYCRSGEGIPGNVVNLIEFNQLLQAYTHNNLQAISDSSTPKHELLHIIRNISPNNELLGDYALIAGLIIKLFGFKLKAMSKFIITSSSGKTVDRKDLAIYNINNQDLTPSERLAITNAGNIMKEVYVELIDAILFKMRDIEMKVNILRGTQDENIFHSLEIKVPGMKDDYSPNDNNMMGIPTTTRSPLDCCIDIDGDGNNQLVVEFAELPSFEFYSLFDEYARRLPGMDECLYYSEAVNFTSIINKINAIIDNMIVSATKFLANGSVKQAADYVKKNEGKLKSMKITGNMSGIIPFKKDISISFLNSLINKINTFDPSIMTSDENIEKFFTEVFGDPKLALIFDETKVKKENTYKVFNNYIMCGIDPETNLTGEIKPKELPDEAAIKKEMEIWIDNVTTYDQGLKVVTDKFKTLKNSVNALKGKLTNMGSSNTSNTSTSSSNSSSAPTMDISNSLDKDMAQQAAAPKQNNPQNEAKIQAAVIRLQSITSKITRNLLMALITSIKTQYSYIQQAEKLGAGTTTNANQQNNNEQTI